VLTNGAAAVVVHGGTHSTRAMGSYNDTIEPSMVHDIGVIGLVIGGALILFYLYVFREIRKETR